MLTGQLRTVEFTKRILRDTFKDADFFLSVDRDNSTQNAYQNSVQPTSRGQAEEICAYFQPRSAYVGSGLPSDWANAFERRIYLVSHHNSGGEVFSPKSIAEQNIFSYDPRFAKKIVSVWQFRKLLQQYFYVHKAAELIKAEEDKALKKYDLIVRLRFDQLLYPIPPDPELISRMAYTEDNVQHVNTRDYSLDIDYSPVRDDQVVAMGYGQCGNYFYVNDQHFVAKRDAAMKVASFYSSLPAVIKQCIREDCYPTARAQMEYFYAKFLCGLGLEVVSAEDLGYGGMFIRQSKSRIGSLVQRIYALRHLSI